MSDAAEEAMDGSAASGEESEQKPESPEKTSSSPDKSSLWGVGEIIEGKRAKKSVERLDMQAPKKTVKLSIGDGSGEKLGDIPRTLHQLNKMKTADLVPLHSLLFDRRGKLSLIKKNIRQFNGFPFDADSEQFNKKREKLQKNFTNAKLKLVCAVLDLEKKGTHSDLVDRIMAFLVSPRSSGKRVPMKKKKRSKKKLSGDDSKPKKSKKKRSSSKQKPSSTSGAKKSGSKSKAIVMDSSSDEDEEDEGEEKTAAAESEGSESEGSEAGSGAESEAGSESGSGEKDEEEEEQSEEEEEESPKPKARAKAKKTTPAKKRKTPKKPAKKRSRKEASESESAEDEPQKKKSKPAAKTKKADSSSNSKTNTKDDSSDEDEPLSKMVKKTPSDEQLKETVQSLLKEADLEELTMKQICQKVFDVYPGHDLSSKKDFIKRTVKSLIT